MASHKLDIHRTPLDAARVATAAPVALTAADLGLLISEAVANHNDVDGVAWRGVAREVADALKIALIDAPVSTGFPECGSFVA